MPSNYNMTRQARTRILALAYHPPPAKIKEHEPTAVKRDSSDQRIVEKGQEGRNSEEAAEKASGMTKGTAGAAETGSEYEGAAGTNR